MNHSVESQIRDYFEQVDQTHGPLTASAVLERAARVQVIPESSPGRPSSQRSMRWAWAVGLVLFVGIAILLSAIGSDEDPADEPTTTSVPTSIATTIPTPALLETGILETSIGPADWWTVSGAGGALPAAGGWLFETPTGYELVVGPGDGPAEYWTSHDGRSWNQGVLPDGLAGVQDQDSLKLHYVGDESWLVADSEAWARDGNDWRDIAFPADLVMPWFGRVDDDVWLVSTSPLGIWRLDGDTWTSFETGVSPQELDETAAYTGRGAAGVDGTVVVSWDADTITVIDPDGNSAAITPSWAAQVNQTAADFADELAVFADETGFVAFVVDWMQGTECFPTRPGCDTPPDINEITTWTSPDGITWVNAGHPGFAPDGKSGPGGTFVSFETVGSFLFAGVQDSQGSSKLWYSADGLDWEDARIPFLGSLSFDRVGDGWVYYDSGPMYTSNDLRSWNPVQTPAGATLGDTGGLISWASSGNLFYVSKKPDGGDATYWIADFAD